MKKAFYILVFILSVCHEINGQWVYLPNPGCVDLNQYMSHITSVAAVNDSVCYWALDVTSEQASTFSTVITVSNTHNFGYAWSSSYYNSMTGIYLKKINTIAVDTGYLIRNYAGYNFIDRTADGFHSIIYTNYTFAPEFVGVKMLSVNDVFTVDKHGNIYRLVGNSYSLLQSLPVQFNYNYALIEATRSHYLYVVCGSGNVNNYILRSLDTGITWDTCLQTNNVTLNDINFLNDSLGFAVGDNGNLFKTSDAGDSWINVSTGTIHRLNSVDFMNSQVGVAAGDSGTLLRTNDGGSTWFFIAPPNSYYLYNVKFPKKDSTLTIQSKLNSSWYETELYKTNIGNVTGIISPSEFKPEWMIYPNPSDGNVFIQCSEKIKEFQISLYDIMGRKVIEKNISSDSNPYHLQIHSVPGIYILELETDHSKVTRKLFIR